MADRTMDRFAQALGLGSSSDRDSLMNALASIGDAFPDSLGSDVGMAMDRNLSAPNTNPLGVPGSLGYALGQLLMDSPSEGGDSWNLPTETQTTTGTPTTAEMILRNRAALMGDSPRSLTPSSPGALPSSAPLQDPAASAPAEQFGKNDIYKLLGGEQLPADFGDTFSKSAAGTSARASERYSRAAGEGKADNQQFALEQLLADKSVPSELRQQAATVLGSMANTERTTASNRAIETYKADRDLQKQKDDAIGTVLSDYLKRMTKAKENPLADRDILEKMDPQTKAEFSRRSSGEQKAILEAHRNFQIMNESLGLVNPEMQAVLKELPQFKQVIGGLSDSVRQIDRATPAAAASTATDGGMTAGEILLALAAGGAAVFGGKKAYKALKGRGASKLAKEIGTSKLAKGASLASEPPPSGASILESVFDDMRTAARRTPEPPPSGASILESVFDDVRTAARRTPEPPPSGASILESVFDAQRAAARQAPENLNAEVLRGVFDEFRKKR